MVNYQFSIFDFQLGCLYVSQLVLRCMYRVYMVWFEFKVSAMKFSVTKVYFARSATAYKVSQRILIYSLNRQTIFALKKITLIAD